jgi:hypothetical protein
MLVEPRISSCASDGAPKNKDYSPPEGWTISYHLLLSKKASAGFLKKAGEENVQVLGLADLFAK